MPKATTNNGVGLTDASLAARLVRELATIPTTSWAYLLVTKPLQPTASALLGCAPHPISTTNGTPDGSEKDEQTDGGDHRGYPGVNGDLPVRHLAADRFTVVDITAFVSVEFTRAIKEAVPDGASNLKRWRDAVVARPSARV